MDARRPLLVTGSHRSGTGWVSEMLAAAPSPELAYIWEPFSLRARPGICDAPLPLLVHLRLPGERGPVPGPDRRHARLPLSGGRRAAGPPLAQGPRALRPRLDADGRLPATPRRPPVQGPDRALLLRLARGHVRDGRPRPDPAPGRLRGQHRAAGVGPSVRPFPPTAADDARPTRWVRGRDPQVRGGRAAPVGSGHPAVEPDPPPDHPVPRRAPRLDVPSPRGPLARAGRGIPRALRSVRPHVDR